MRYDLNAKPRQLVFDPRLSRQTVKRMKHRSDMGGPSCSENDYVVSLGLLFKMSMLLAQAYYLK